MFWASIGNLVLAGSLAAPAADDKESTWVTLCNPLSIPAVAWVDGKLIGWLPPRSMNHLTRESGPDAAGDQPRSSHTLIIAGIDADGDLFYGAQLFQSANSDQAAVLWWGPPLAPELRTLQVAEPAQEIRDAETILSAVSTAARALQDARKKLPTAGNVDRTLRDGHLATRLIVGTTSPDVFTNSIGITMVRILPGRFMMGSPPQEGGYAPERPHEVRITRPFAIGMTEVTQEQWSALMPKNPSGFQGEELPVETVSWHMAKAFCDALATKEGKPYRLPTEAEWEYACRAGSQTMFSFGDNVSLVGKYGWHNRNAKGRTHPVAQKLPNQWGLFDMHGNVLEWCADWWAWRYPVQPQVDPIGPATGDQRTCRGGRWSFYDTTSRSGARDAKPPNYTWNDQGFRVVVDCPIEAPELQKLFFTSTD